MRRQFWFSTAIAGFSAACLFVTGPAHGQEPVPTGEARPDQIKVIQVHGDVASLANTLAYLAEGSRTQVMTDARTNSLILRGPAESLETIMAVIQRLDQPIRQVEVRLLVAELAGSSDATPEFDADFEVAVSQVRKLQAEGDAAVLKRIQLSSLENKAATVQLGETQALAVGENFGPGGRQPTRSYQMQDLGTLVEVTPRVATDGKVLLDLSFELTRLAPARRAEPDEADPFVPQGRVTAVLKSSLAVPNDRTVTVTDFASASTPADARLLMLISARVVE
jgi:type II secretory pathway component GspD/PulD (secretin)